jgi:hypothetical protein
LNFNQPKSPIKAPIKGKVQTVEVKTEENKTKEKAIEVAR